MPAPFVIAHLQIAQLLEDARASLAATQRAQVFLTNALTGWVPARHPQSNFGFPAFVEERDAAEAVKQADTILVILGNPPYNGYAGIAKIEEERDLSDSYRSQVEGLPAPNGQGLNELYVRFFRIAERRITQNRQHRGIFSFISNYSWLDGLSHPTMRHHLQQSFNSIYIDNLHGDRRISEYAPDGRTSETVFAMQGTSVGIKVGTAVATLVKTGEAIEHSSIRYRDFEDARSSERRSHLLASVHDEESYGTLNPNPILGLPFKPRRVEADYLAWPRLPELFPTSFPGIKTSRDSLVVDIDRERLEQRMKQYVDPDVTDAQITGSIPSAMENSAHFDARAVRQALQERPLRLLPNASALTQKETTEVIQRLAFRPWQVVRYTYRPFDVRWLYWEPETTLIDRKRSEYIEQVFFPAPCIATQQKSRGASSAPQVISHVACLDLLDRGASCFPLMTINSAGTLLSGVEIQPNLSDRSVAFINSVSGDPSSLFFHALAIMHTPLYRTENSGALLGDWPRIPLPATGELLTHSANLGRRLAELLDPESDIQLQAEWSFLARLSIPPELPEGTPDRDRRNAARFALTAGWGGPGQGATVMPRRGDARERDYSSAELSRIATLAATLQLSTDNALDLLGARCVDVYLNGESYWAAVPTNVWEYTLGGYQVLKKWLSYREEPLLGRPLHEDEARYFSQVVRRIAAILLTGPALDASYAAILPTAIGLSGR